MEFFAYKQWRKDLFKRMMPQKGELILEIGVGTGKNIPFYGESEYVSFDVSRKMILKAKERARGKEVTLLLADAEFLPFKDNTSDKIYSTFVFCSVENPIDGLNKAYRVLTHGGKAFFLEHMLPKSRIVQPFFHILNPFVRILGPEINRKTYKKAYKRWLRKQKAAFRKFLREQELERRRKGKNLEQWPYIEALWVFSELMEEIDSFEKPVQQRLRKIKKNWGHFTAFYFVKGAPATNNLIENYYSTSLKTHRKKQLRSDRGIENLMKLSAMKRAGLLGRCKKTLLEAFLMFVPFLKPG
jgi:ubiquinone/menaquinone biosynthesis C-methylase UbiE